MTRTLPQTRFPAAHGHVEDPGADAVEGARETLRRFVLDRNPALDPASLHCHTPLLGERLVTSLHLVDLLLLVESLRQAPIDVRRMRPDSFRSIDAIVEAFLVTGTGHGG